MESIFVWVILGSYRDNGKENRPTIMGEESTKELNLPRLPCERRGLSAPGASPNP